MSPLRVQVTFCVAPRAQVTAVLGAVSATDPLISKAALFVSKFRADSAVSLTLIFRLLPIKVDVSVAGMVHVHRSFPMVRAPSSQVMAVDCQVPPPSIDNSILAVS